jgi:hypothetical protein
MDILYQVDFPYAIMLLLLEMVGLFGSAIAQ